MKLEVVPFLKENTDEFDYFGGFVKNVHLTVNEIVNYFMKFLTNIENYERIDLRNKFGFSSNNNWTIIEPSTGKKFNGMNNDIP